MKNIYLLITIIRREDSEEYGRFYEKHGIGITYSLNCNGTAHKRTLDLLGIERSEKSMLFTKKSETAQRADVRKSPRGRGVCSRGVGSAYQEL